MPIPNFHWEPLNEEFTRFGVYTENEPEMYFGIVYETVGGGWVADWDTCGRIAMPGFRSCKDATEALYWFAPPQQAFGSRPRGAAGAP